MIIVHELFMINIINNYYITLIFNERLAQMKLLLL